MFGLHQARKHLEDLDELGIIGITRQLRYVLRRSTTIYPLYAFALLLVPCRADVRNLSYLEFCGINPSV